MSTSGQTVDYQIEGATYEGYMAVPDAPKGLVAIAHAWGGIGDVERATAERMADWGFAGFAMDVYGKGQRGETTEECEALMTPLASNRPLLQSRLAASLAVAKEKTGQSNAAAIGFCFGGLSVLDMARAGMDVTGVASFHGLFGAPGNTDGQQIDARVLVLHGWDDPMATPDDVATLGKEMIAAKADWRFHGYGRTLHAFTNPAADNPDFGTVYSPDSEARSFAELKTFLSECL